MNILKLCSRVPFPPKDGGTIGVWVLLENLAKLDNKPDLPEGYVWIAESQLDRYGKPRLFERLLEAVRAYNQSKL